MNSTQYFDSKSLPLAKKHLHFLCNNVFPMRGTIYDAVLPEDFCYKKLSIETSDGGNVFYNSQEV